MPTLDKIAPEIQHMIFALLEWYYVPNLRLTCKAMADVGAYFTFSRVHLAFNTKMFEQLEQISKHPAGIYVRSLDYNVRESKEHGLETFTARGEEHMVDRTRRISLLWDPDPRPARDAPTRDWRAWRRCLLRQCREEWRKQGLRLLDQQSLRDANYGQARLDSALAQFVNLKHLRLFSLEGHKNGDPFPDGYPDPPRGLPQILSVLQAIDNSGQRLESLGYFRMNWRILAIEDDQYRMMKRVVAASKSIQFCILAHEGDDDMHDISAAAFAKLCREGRPLDFFTSMPNLQSLRVEFRAWNDYQDAEAIDLKHIVGQCHWRNLREVDFYGFATTGEELLQFFQRHAETLKSVSLSGISSSSKEHGLTSSNICAIP
ncbi:MAG: hypothetical protein Q9168_005050 [Polycauliona sp. 1 TL-2023]